MISQITPHKPIQQHSQKNHYPILLNTKPKTTTLQSLASPLNPSTT
jgi:hypothetical protein